MASKVFACKWATPCCICKKMVQEGEDAHFVVGHLTEAQQRLEAKGQGSTFKKDKLAHAGCWPENEPMSLRDMGEDWTDFSAEVPDLFPETGPVVYGRRNHEKYCGDCFTVHAGDCA